MSTILKFCVATSVTMSFMNEPVIHPVGALKLRMVMPSRPLFAESSDAIRRFLSKVLAWRKSSDAPRLFDATKGFAEDDRVMMDAFIKNVDPSFWSNGSFFLEHSDDTEWRLLPSVMHNMDSFIAQTFMLVDETIEEAFLADSQSFKESGDYSTGMRVLGLFTKLYKTRNAYKLKVDTLVKLDKKDEIDKRDYIDHLISEKDKEAMNMIKNPFFRKVKDERSFLSKLREERIHEYERTLHFPLQLSDMPVIEGLVNNLILFYEDC